MEPIWYKYAELTLVIPALWWMIPAGILALIFLKFKYRKLAILSDSVMLTKASHFGVIPSSKCYKRLARKLI